MEDQSLRGFIAKVEREAPDEVVRITEPGGDLDPEQQRALEQAIDQLSDSVVLFDYGGRVRYANDAYLEWSSNPASEVSSMA